MAFTTILLPMLVGALFGLIGGMGGGNVIAVIICRRHYKKTGRRFSLAVIILIHLGLTVALGAMGAVLLAFMFLFFMFLIFWVVMLIGLLLGKFS